MFAAAHRQGHDGVASSRYKRDDFLPTGSTNQEDLTAGECYLLIQRCPQVEHL